MNNTVFPTYNVFVRNNRQICIATSSVTTTNTFGPVYNEFGWYERYIRVFPILYKIGWISRIRWIQLESSMTEGYWKLYCVSHSQFALWCSGYDWESVGCEFKYRNAFFWKEKPSLISLILNTKSEKHEWGPLTTCLMISAVSDTMRSYYKKYTGSRIQRVCLLQAIDRILVRTS